MKTEKKLVHYNVEFKKYIYQFDKKLKIQQIKKKVILIFVLKKYLKSPFFFFFLR